MNEHRLPADAHIGPVHLRVTDLDRALHFYTGPLGLHATTRDQNAATLATTASGAPLVTIAAEPDTVPRPNAVYGLYHYAILYPDRASLAHTVRSLIKARWPFTGFSDHGVSEAAYLDDPDGNGIELYADRPRSLWRSPDGKLVMYTRPLDIDNLLAESAVPASTAGDGVRMGHVHLHVRDLERATSFYHDVIGMDITSADYPGARFLSAGGYHHHIGLNTWARREPPDRTAGLRAFELVVPGEGARELRERLRAGRVEVWDAGGAMRFVDPDGNSIVARGAPA